MECDKQNTISHFKEVIIFIKQPTKRIFDE